MRRDHLPVALHTEPIDAAILVAKEIPGRNAIELRPADIGAHRIDQCIPAAERLDKTSGCNVELPGRQRAAPLRTVARRLQEGGLLRSGESVWTRSLRR